MKKLVPLLTLSALLLTACNETDIPVPQPEEPPQSVAAAPTLTPEELGREEHTTLTYYLEGEETEVPATLAVGDGWSLYMPDEGWIRSEDGVGQLPGVLWTSELNADVRFRVVDLGTRTLADAQSWVTEQYPDYTFVEDKRGGLGGTNDRQQCANATLLEHGGKMFALLDTYPLEASEGFGVTLCVIGDSFQFHD